jgi:hypothetical protein
MQLFFARPPGSRRGEGPAGTEVDELKNEVPKWEGAGGSRRGVGGESLRSIAEPGRELAGKLVEALEALKELEEPLCW